MNEPAVTEPAVNEPAVTEPAVNEPAVNDIVDLQKRVETAGGHFSQMAEQHRTDGMRLARLLESVEKRFARSRLEIDRLGSELTRSRAENQKLHGLLQSLIAAAEDCGRVDSSEAMSGLERRMSSLLSGTAADPDSSPADDKAGDEDPPSTAGGRTAEPSGAESRTPAKVLADGAASSDPASEEDLNAVSRIIQKISLLTGDFVDQKDPPASGGTVERLAAKSG